MRSFALLSLAAVAFGAVPAHAAGAASVLGQWSGEMRQIDVDRESRYPMTVTIKGKTGTTSYPSLKCAGSLTKIGETKGGYVLYQETIKNEPGGTCIDGVVMVTTDAGKLVLGWYAAFEGQPSLASAVLVNDPK